MRKKLLLIIIVLASSLLVNLILCAVTFETTQVAGSNIMRGANLLQNSYPVKYEDRAGIPLKSSVTFSQTISPGMFINQVQDIGYLPPDNRGWLEKLWQDHLYHQEFEFFRAWQFYADWLIIAAAEAGVVYGIQRSYAYYRH